MYTISVHSHDEQQTPPNEVSQLGVRELRASLTDAIRRAAAGQRTVITSHGRPTAQIGPIDTESPGMHQLIASGAVVAPRRRNDNFTPSRPTPVWAGTRIAQALRDVRG